MAGAHQSLEHAEHIEHAGHHGDFGAVVAMSMAVIAALLAIVTMMSHRSHNETILFHSDANRLQTQANILHTRASDTWGQYQAKKIRTSEYGSNLLMLPLFAKDGAPPAAIEAARKEWADTVERYNGPGPDELKDLKSKAEKLVAEADKQANESVELLEKAEVSHARSTRFDLGELGVEMGLVLCSIAALTKRKKFWGAAIAMAAIGATVALSGWLGLFISGGEGGEGEHEGSGHAAAVHEAPKEGSKETPKSGEGHEPAKSEEHGPHAPK
jgi:hypothetical protein